MGVKALEATPFPNFQSISIQRTKLALIVYCLAFFYDHMTLDDMRPLIQNFLH